MGLFTFGVGRQLYLKSMGSNSSVGADKGSTNIELIKDKKHKPAGD